MTSQSLSEPASYCCECDALPDGCEHHGHRYLDPIVYERAADGWKAPENEQARWNNHEYMRSLGSWTHHDTSAIKTPPLKDVAATVAQVVFLTEDLDSLLKDAYLLSPHQTGLLADDINRQAKQGRLTSPGGLLAKRLRELVG